MKLIDIISRNLTMKHINDIDKHILFIKTRNPSSTYLRLSVPSITHLYNGLCICIECDVTISAGGSKLALNSFGTKSIKYVATTGLLAELTDVYPGLILTLRYSTVNGCWIIQ
jgi:hypothetical protein